MARKRKKELGGRRAERGSHLLNSLFTEKEETVLFAAHHLPIHSPYT